MTPQTPAEGISKEAQFLGTEIYKVDCTCTDPDDSITVWIELGPDEDVPEVEVTFYTMQQYAGWQGFWDRLNDAVGCLLGRPMKRSQTTLLTKQAALNFATALQDSIDNIENKG